MLPGLAAEMFNKFIEEFTSEQQAGKPPKSAEDFMDVMQFCVDLQSHAGEAWCAGGGGEGPVRLINEFDTIKEEDQAKLRCWGDFAMLETVLDESEGQQEDRIKQFAADDRGRQGGQPEPQGPRQGCHRRDNPGCGGAKGTSARFVEDLAAKVEAQQAEAKRIVKIQETFKWNQPSSNLSKLWRTSRSSGHVGRQGFGRLISAWAESVFDQIDVAFMEKVQKMGKLCVKLEQGLQPTAWCPRSG